jgi:ATP/maltotriose-dependent transcriptional regulator MalT
MGYEPLVKKNPLRVLNLAGNDKKMGLVMARAGLGKTALLVQIALDSILRGKRVVHISIGENLEKNQALV